MLLGNKKDRWLDTAVSGIRFYLDRAAVRRELEGHLEDKLAGLRRAFPDIPEEEAELRALSAMGDAEELKTELARVHRPWLGRLWKASQWAVWLTLVVMNLISLGTRTGYDNSPWGRSGPEVYHRIGDGEKARLGGYTFQITGAAYLDRPEEVGDVLQVVLRASSPRAWERIAPEAVLGGLTAVGPDGTRYSMTGEGHMSCERTVEDELGSTETSIWLTGGGDLCRWGPTWREFSVFLPAEGWEPGDRVTVELESELGGFALSVPVTEKVEVPAW